MANDKFELKQPQITFEAVKRRILAENTKIIYYSIGTCWWTMNPRDLYRHPECGLPCDPRGGMLMECHEPLDFLTQAEQNPEHYGKHGIKAFMAAYHGGVRIKASGLPTCFDGWDKYNELIDEFDAQQAERTGE